MNKMGIEGMCINIIKALHYRSKANITLNSGNLKAFPLRSGTRYECPLLPLLFKIKLKVLNIAFRNHVFNQKGRKDIEYDYERCLDWRENRFYWGGDGFSSWKGFPRWLSGRRIHLLMQGMRVQSLGQEDPLEEEMATYPSILACNISRTEEPDGL